MSEEKFNYKLFNLGEVFVTSGINAKMDKSETFSRDVVLSLHQFESGDWGDTSEEDALLNDRSVKEGTGDIMGAYETTEGRIWIKTDRLPDKTITTVLFPQEY